MPEFVPDPYEGQENETPEARMFRQRANPPDSWEAKHKSRCLKCNLHQYLAWKEGELIGVCPSKRCGYTEWLGGTPHLAWLHPGSNS